VTFPLNDEYRIAQLLLIGGKAFIPYWSYEVTDTDWIDAESFRAGSDCNFSSDINVKSAEITSLW